MHKLLAAVFDILIRNNIARYRGLDLVINNDDS